MADTPAPETGGPPDPSAPTEPWVPDEEPAAYEPEPAAAEEEPWEEPGTEYAEPYAYEEYAEGSPESYGWQPLAEPAVFPLGGAIVAIIALAVLAFARLDGLISSLDLSPFTRGAAQALAQEAGTLLLGGSLLVSGIVAARLSAGSKAALVIVGGLILLGGPFLAL